MVEKVIQLKFSVRTVGKTAATYFSKQVNKPLGWQVFTQSFGKKSVERSG